LAALLGVPLHEFCAAYAACRDGYDRGWSDRFYWRAVGGRLNIDMTEAQVAALTALDIWGWTATRPDVLDLITELAHANVPMALLSNAPRSHGRAFRRQHWASHFHHLLFSGDLGLAKPDRRVWRILGDRLDTEPANCVFFDDRPVNVESALAAGLRAEHWVGAAMARRQLVDLRLLEPRSPHPPSQRGRAPFPDAAHGLTTHSSCSGSGR
jgi:putative hydrolase of the HAD superfamily